MIIEITENNKSDLKNLKDDIGSFFINNYSEDYIIDEKLKNEAERWYNLCCDILGLLDRELEELDNGDIIEIKDEIGFPFEILRSNGFFLGEKFRIFRSSGEDKNKELMDFSIATLFDQDKDERNNRIEETILIKPDELNNKIYNQSIIFISGHFDNLIDTISNYSFNKNSFLFFNVCNSFNTIDILNGEYKKYALSYFDIPIDPDYKIFDEFPIYFFNDLIEGEKIIDSFWDARNYIISKYKSALPLLFSLFIPNQNDTHFKVFMKKNRKEVLKNIEQKFSLIPINNINNVIMSEYPDILFDHSEKQKNLQYIINDKKNIKKYIWIKGEKSGSGKTTLLLKQYLKFQYTKFPIFFSFSEYGLKEVSLEEFKEVIVQKLGHEEIVELKKSNIKPLIFIDKIDLNNDIYEKQKQFINEIETIFGYSTIVINSKKDNKIEEFYTLNMENKDYFEEVKKYYNISDRIKIPEFPIFYAIASKSGINEIDNKTSLNKSEILKGYIVKISEGLIDKNVNDYKDKSIFYLLSLIAYFISESNNTDKDIEIKFDEFKGTNDSWKSLWIYHKKRDCPLESDDILELLLKIGVICKNADRNIEFVHSSFYEFFLANYYFWKYEENPVYSKDLKYTEIPDYMLELLGKSDMSNFSDTYIKIILERLFYIRNYEKIDIIIKDNIEVFERSQKLLNVLIPGYYFARKEVNAVKVFYDLKIFEKHERKDNNGEYSDSFFDILNVFFDNWIMDDFFQLAHFLEDKIENKVKIYGILSRGYLKIGNLYKSSFYLEKKEQNIREEEKEDKNRLRNEKGLLHFFKFKKHKNEENYNSGMDELTKAVTLYKDIKEEGNYLFTLREKLCFYLEANLEAKKKKEEITKLKNEIDKIGNKGHPRNDYINFLFGLADIKLFENKDEGLIKIKNAAKAFEDIKLEFEATVVYLFLLWYSKDDEALIKAKNVFKKLKKKRNDILKYWNKIKTGDDIINNQKIPEFEDQFIEVKKILETNELKRDINLGKKIESFTLIS